MQKGNVSTEYRQELRQRILEAASAEFKAKGIKAVKMDDIARQLSVSKRTVYEIYENKEELLMACVKRDNELFRERTEQFAAEGNPSVLDVALFVYRTQLRELKNISPLFLADIHRYPAISDWVETMRKQREETAATFFRRGVEEGVFRPDINFVLIDSILSGTKGHLIDQELFTRFSPIEIFRNVVIFYLRGCCTLKGIAELEEKLRLLDLEA